MSRREAFEQAVSPHTRGLYAFIRHLNRGECDDIYQEAMLAAWQGFESLQDPDALRPWLYGIARRKAMDAYRRQYRKDAREEGWPAELPQNGFEGQSTLKLDLDQALSTLKAEDRALLYLVFNQGFTYRQAGEALGIPEGTVKSRVYALKRRLKLLLGDKEETA
ncbi:MAG: RNA polymerase sigma factor [Eubacteriales bacterium]|nr:RNA polymerase sigma factor [Eubacteriales bacterium]